MSNLAVATKIIEGPFRVVPRRVGFGAGLGAYETPSEVLAAIAPQLDALVTDRADRAAQAAHDKTKSDVVMYSLIAGAVGVVGGGLLGWALARKFR